MPDTAVLDRPAATGDSAEINHIVCCDDDTALCGADVTGDPWSDEGPECRACVTEWSAGPPCPVVSCERRGR